MKNLELLTWITKEEKASLNQSAKMYKMGGSGVSFKIKSVTDEKVFLSVIQGKHSQTEHLSHKELVNRGFSVMQKINLNGRTLVVQPIVYQSPDLSNFDTTKIAELMEKYDINQARICVGLGIDKSTLSQVINGKKPLPKWKKAAFHYFFKTFELQQKLNNE